MTSADSDGDPSGRFTKGHRGRPKGSKNKRKLYSPTEFSASVTEAARAKLENLMGKALSVIEQKLDNGDVRTAIWVLDRCLPRQRDKLSETIPGADTSSLEGIVQTARTATEMTVDGRLGLEETGRVLTILTNTANLLGYQRIGELREMLEELEKKGAQGRAASTGDYPIWGRLAERCSK